MAVSSFHEELMEAKVTLLQYDNLLRELKRVSYLKQEGDEDFEQDEPEEDEIDPERLQFNEVAGEFGFVV